MSDKVASDALPAGFTLGDAAGGTVIYLEGIKRLYVASRGMRREGEMWVVLDHGYAQLIELRGTTKDLAIARAVAMLRDGTIDRMLLERHNERRATATGLFRSLGGSERTKGAELTLNAAQQLYAKFLGKTEDDAICAMAEIAIMAKSHAAGWGRLHLQALRELGGFLIQKGRGRGRPATKTSADEEKLSLGLSASRTTTSAPMPKMLRGSAGWILTPIWRRKMNRL